MRSNLQVWIWSFSSQHFVSFVINIYSMKTYVLLHFENKNDVTIIAKFLYRATCCRQVALWSLIMIVTSFFVQNLIEHRFSWNKCFIICRTNAVQHDATRRSSSQIVKLKISLLKYLWVLQSWYNVTSTWRSGYCCLNKGEYNLNQSKDDSFVERVAKNNSWNNGNRHQIHDIFPINCFVVLVTLAWKQYTVRQWLKLKLI